MFECKINTGESFKWYLYKTDNKYIYNASEENKLASLAFGDNEFKVYLQFLLPNFKDQFATICYKVFKELEDIDPEDYFEDMINNSFNGHDIRKDKNVDAIEVLTELSYIREHRKRLKKYVKILYEKLNNLDIMKGIFDCV